VQTDVQLMHSKAAGLAALAADCAGRDGALTAPALFACLQAAGGGAGARCGQG
jgi:hypothetical protein